MNLAKYIALGAIFIAAPLLAQTAAEQLQRAIFKAETQGNKDEAMNVYRQLAYASTTPVEIAAQAQYRLAQALLQKGDLSQATREMERLERTFPDQSALIARLAAARTVGVTSPPANTVDLGKELFDLGRTVTVHGVISGVEWVNPSTWVAVSESGKAWKIRLTSPNSLVRTGMTRATLKTGDTLTVVGAIAKDGSATAMALSVTTSDGKVVFDRAKVEAESAAAQNQPAQAAPGVFPQVFTPTQQHR